MDWWIVCFRSESDTRRARNAGQNIQNVVNTSGFLRSPSDVLDQAVSRFGYVESDGIGGEARSRERKTLRLSAPNVSAAGDQPQLVVHELSDTGLLLESSLPLETGEQLDLITADQETKQVRIVWACGHYFGCEFEAAGAAAEVRSARPKGMDELPKKGSPEAVTLAQHQLHELSMAIERITSVVDRAINQLGKRER